MIIKSLDGTTERLTDYDKQKIKRRLNGAFSLSFTVTKTERNKHSFDLVQHESQVIYEGQTWVIKQMKETQRGSSVKTITAHHILFDIVDDVLYTVTTGSLTIDQALGDIFSGTKYSYTVVDTFETKDLGDFGDDNKMSLFHKVLNEYGAEYEVTDTHIDIYSRIGSNKHYQFRYKNNIETIEKTVDTSNLSTYIKGYGDGVEAEYNSPNQSTFGIRHARPVTDQRYTTQSALLERIKREIVDEPDVSIKISMHELIKQEIGSVSLGDDVYVIYEPLNINVLTRVKELEVFPETDNPPNITLSNIRSNAVDIISDLEGVKKNVGRAIDTSGKVIYDSLTIEVKQATEALNNSMTELDYPTGGGIHAVDPNDNTKVVVFNSAGIGVSTDGLTTVDSAITSDGIMAEKVTGTLGDFAKVNASHIVVGSDGKTIDDGLITSAPTWDAKEKGVVKSSTEPAYGSTAIDDLWLDTSASPNVLKRCSDKYIETLADGTTNYVLVWKKVTPTIADEILEGSTRKWAGESGADITGNHTANDTTNVNGRLSTDVDSDAKAGKTAKDTVDTNKSTWDLASNINSDGTFATTKLSGAVDVATNNINASSYFYWNSDGLIAIDSTDNLKRVKLTSGGLGITTDGGTTYNNAITGAGIVATHITSGTLDAGKLTVQNLSASSINTGTLDASIVTVSNLNASNITTGTLAGDYIVGGTIQGSTLKTTGTATISEAKDGSGSVITDSIRASAVRTYIDDGHVYLGTSTHNIYMYGTVTINGYSVLTSASTIDADTVDGKNATDFATSTHNHQGTYVRHYYSGDDLEVYVNSSNEWVVYKNGSLVGKAALV